MSSFSPPPRFVPTLTEVVEQTPMLVPTAGNVDSANLAVAELEGQLVHRVMQRIDLILERSLREAVGQLILSTPKRWHRAFAKKLKLSCASR